MRDPELLDEFVEALDDLLFSAFGADFLFEGADPAFFPVPDDRV